MLILINIDYLIAIDHSLVEVDVLVDEAHVHVLEGLTATLSKGLREALLERVL